MAGKSPFTWKIPALTSFAMLIGCMASVARADQWAWSFNSGSYPTKEAALAAMHASSPANSVLTLETSLGGMGNASASYQYAAPTVAPTITLLTYCTSGGGPELSCPPGHSYATEASAVAADVQFNSQTGVCNVSAATPSSGWINESPGNLDLYDVRSYAYTYSLILTTGCQTTVVSNGSFNIFRYNVPNCPAGYPTITGFNGPCSSTNVALITHQVLDCPQNAGSSVVGDPCDASTGDYFQTDVDYGGPTLRFTRSYHSETLPSHNALGIGWSHNFGGRLIISQSNGAPSGIERPDGFQDQINLINGKYIGVSGAGIHVTQNASTGNFTAFLADGSSEIYTPSGMLSQIVARSGAVTTLAYNASGNLSVVTGPYGHTLTLSYSNNQISSIADPSGALIQYSYDSQNNLKTVTYPDGRVRTYLYENASLPNNLTGVMDESNNRFSTIAYDSMGRVISSQQANGANAVTISGYGDATGATTTTVMDALGANLTYNFTSQRFFTRRVQGIVKNTLTQGYTVPLPSTDAQQRATQSVDPNGNITNYAYDADHLTSKTEAVGSAVARTTSFVYLSTNSALPTLVTEALRQTSYTYYSGSNNVQTKTVTDTTVTPNVSRTWSYTYNGTGQVLTVKGPRTDVTDLTTYTYYSCTTASQCGQLETVTNALKQVTVFNTYNAHGQPLTVTDPNGVVTTLTYDARQRLLSREVGTETTGYNRYPTGLVKVVTLPDGSSLTYTYDGAHRLTDLTDGLGNHIHYTLDAMGNHTAENSYDPSNALHRTHTRVINALNQLYQDVNAAGTAAVTTTYTYDSNGNQASADAPLSRNTSDRYDALNHLIQITDPNSGITKLGYDANDNLVSVNDPRGLTTSYTRNGFGDVTQTVSPDTGTTISTYDLGGNLKSSTDARGALANYSYDAMNRVTQVAYADQTINFTYDSGTNGIGRLTGASDANHSMSWAYDTHGRVTGKGQTIGTVTKSVGYAYTNGDLTAMVTPSGQTILYSYNNNHQVTGISVNGTVLLSNVTYEPFGQVNGWIWGNGTAVTRSYDTDGKIASISSAGTKTYGYDDAFRITFINDTESGASDWTYGYDLLDRLTSAAGGSTTIGLTYDANGNRLTQSGTFNSIYNISSTSNQIVSITGTNGRTYSYDAAGNTLGYNGRTSFTYNNQGRMIANGNTSTGVSSPYVYNALGQLIETNLNTVGVRLFWYDESGHYLGVYNASGGLGDETVWLGDIPVATIVPSGHSFVFYYIHTDHLNTPRQATLPSNNTQMWTWFSDPFGTTAENQNPEGNGTFNYPPRFPGQVSSTQVAGLYQNGFRDYDPQTGRYGESDPIGLQGGANTYAYAAGNPISNRDPTGQYCIALRNSTTYCEYPNGGPAFIVPTPDGFPSYFDSGNVLYHSYDVTRSIGCANPDSVMQGLINSPTPGNAAAAAPGGTFNNAVVGGQPNPVTSYLTTDFTTGNPLVVNITGTNSLFAPGYVARTVTGGVAHTYGEGLNAKQSSLLSYLALGPLGLLAQEIGEQTVWGSQMTNIISNAKRCGCSQ